MEKNRFSKPVAFNRNNESDKKILDHVKKRNFSGYVKKLILADIALKEANTISVNPKTVQASPPKQESAADKLARMQEQLQKGTNNINSDSNGSSDP